MNPKKRLRTKVFVNPDSKPGRIKRYLKPALSILRNNGFDLSVYFTKASGEIQSRAKQAVEDQYDAIIVAGGDGTLNEGINGILPSDVLLGILPFGGSNVLARELRIPLNPLEAATVIARKHTKRIDLGVINGRYFSMMASCGYDAYTISRTSRKIKRIIHRYAYVWAGIKDFFGYRPSNIHVDLDHGKTTDFGTFVVLGNTHFYGGFHQLTPFAEVDDGFLDVCVYKGKTQIGLMRFVLRMLAQKHLSMRDVRYYRTREVSLSAEVPTLVQVDGDILGHLPMTARIAPKVLEVFL
ncbi:diacylglycerol kinase family lipid kinase [bacterium]|nr:diacylglycerol kinase family lipid kinase [bacterium]